MQICMSFILIFMRNAGVYTPPGPRLAIRFPDSLLFHNVAHSFALFCTLQNHNSFLFKRLCTLRPKTLGRTYLPLPVHSFQGKQELEIEQHLGTWPRD